MISGNFKKWHPVWESKDSSVRVEKTEPSFKDKKEEKEPIVIDIAYLEDEEESETEDYYEDDETSEVSVTQIRKDISQENETTVLVVNERFCGYNREGKLEKLKIKSNTLKII
jgi:hypothetical protein